MKMENQMLSGGKETGIVKSKIDKVNRDVREKANNVDLGIKRNGY